jgi:anthranilate synthase component 2
MLLVIDNYDSFIYNLVQYFGEFMEIEVYRNDKITVDEIIKKKPEAILLSPGPGRPENAGICVDVIKELGGKIPIFGVCLGLQAIGYAFGATITYAKQIVHGKSSMIRTKKDPLFHNIMNPFAGARYHSLVIDKNTIPPEMEVIAEAEDEVMAVKVGNMIYGVQFHPESILTKEGKKIIKNFVDMVKI